MLRKHRSRARWGMFPTLAALCGIPLISSCSSGSDTSAVAETANATADPGPLTQGRDTTQTLQASTNGSSVVLITVPEGGPYPEGSRRYLLENRSSFDMDWGIRMDEPWANFSEETGTIAPGDRTFVEVGLNTSLINNLPLGNYEADIILFPQNDAPQAYITLILQVVEPARIEVTPPEPFEATGVVGEIPTPGSKVYRIKNSGGMTASWAVAATMPWVQFAGPTQGVLQPEESVLVTAELSNGVQSLPAGTHEASIRFLNETNTLGNTHRQVFLMLGNDGGGGDDDRVTDGLVALYDFEEAEGALVRDRSGVSPSMDLSIQNTSAVNWAPGSLRLNGSTILQAVGNSSSKLTQACQATDEVTVEAWIQASNVTQDGPARIVTLSGGATERNLTLGQGLWSDLPSDTYNMRLRTTETNLDGMPMLQTSAGSATTGLTHLVYTRRSNGLAKFWVNGVGIDESSVGGNFSTWDNFTFALGNEIGADRPWQGSYHLVALYDRALSSAEIAQNYGAGTGDADASLLNITPLTSFDSFGPVGGPFSPEDKTYTVTNSGTAPMDWRASVDQSWARIAGASQGNLAPGASASVTVEIRQDVASNLPPGYRSGLISFENLTDGYGDMDLTCALQVYTDNGGGGPGLTMEYFEKTGGALDYMGVKVTRTNNTQRVFAPGSNGQEYPGGWVTPGTYTLTVNGPMVHDKKSGKRSGQTRGGDQIVGVVVNKELTWKGWENWGYEVHPDFELQNWGTTKTVTLAPGDVLHVAYGTPVPITFGKRQGSDGMVVYCVPSEPMARGGLWANGHADWSEAMWNQLRNRLIETAPFVDVSTSYFHYGPQDGTLPQILPSDFANEAGDLDNEQALSIGRWLQNRAFKVLQDGPNSVDMEEFDRLFRYFVNNMQIMACWGDGVSSMNFMSHGPRWYPPYWVTRSIVPALSAAVVLDYDPDYEPLYRLLAHMAQRTDMTMPHGGSYTFGNSTSDGGLADHINDDAYTQWLWNVQQAYDMGPKGSHRVNVWGPCYWSRELLGFPQTYHQSKMLTESGPRFNASGDWHGHCWAPDGSGPGWNDFYSGLEQEGANWLWYTDVAKHESINQYSRRNILVQSGHSGFWSKWVQATFVPEPRNPSAGSIGDTIQLDWNNVSANDLQHYRVYRGTSADTLSIIASPTQSAFSDNSVSPGNTYYYRITAVDNDGNESTMSDIVSATP